MIKFLIKVSIVPSCIVMLAACSSSTQMNDPNPTQTVQHGIQQHVEGKSIVDIPEAYTGKIKGLEIVKGKVLHIKDGDTIDVNVKDRNRR